MRWRSWRWRHWRKWCARLRFTRRHGRRWRSLRWLDLGCRRHRLHRRRGDRCGRRGNWRNDRRLRCDDGCGWDYGLWLLCHDRSGNRCCGRRNWYCRYRRTRGHRRRALSRRRWFRHGRRRRRHRHGGKRVRRVIGILVVEIEHHGRGRILCVGFHSALVLATAASATATAAARTRRFITRCVSRMRGNGRRNVRGSGCGCRGQGGLRGTGCRDIAPGTFGCRLWRRLRLALLRRLRILALRLAAGAVVRRTLVAALLLFVAAIA